MECFSTFVLDSEFSSRDIRVVIDCENKFILNIDSNEKRQNKSNSSASESDFGLEYEVA